MLEKLNKNDGFVFIESLMSLSILTIALLILLPSIVDLYTFRMNEKEEVEMYRVLYDSSIIWDKTIQSETKEYGEWVYELNMDENNISVQSKDNEEALLELVSVEFNE